ncbi:MAG: rhomboid family intramembrane serine protease [Nanoarchaeota archaeon]
MENRIYTFWIAGACAIFFILQFLIPGFTDFLLLDQSKPLELWRFVTSMFLHGGLAHIISNLFVLVLFGLTLEKLIGSKRFLMVYFVSGILANIIAINFYQSSLGASGAIFGIIGALIIIRPTLTVFAFGMPMPMFIAGILWIILDLIGVFVPSDVANIAHLTGIAGGIILGIIFRDWSYKEERKPKIIIDENYVRNWEDNYL